MNQIFYIVLVFGIFQPFYTQAELSIVSFDVDCSYINPKYLQDVDIYLLDEGKDNQYYVNFTLIENFPDGSLMTFKMIGATMGEYKVPTGFDVAVETCSAVNEPIIGGRIFEALGMTSCPIPLGTYACPNLTVIETNTLPESFPPNKYVAEFSSKFGDEVFFSCRNYFEIQ